MTPYDRMPWVKAYDPGVPVSSTHVRSVDVENSAEGMPVGEPGGNGLKKGTAVVKAMAAAVRKTIPKRIFSNELMRVRS